MRRWERLYYNGDITIHKYAECLIHNGQLPADLNPKSDEAVEFVMKYREEHKPKDRTKSLDIYDEHLKNSLVEAQAFFNRIRPLIIYKPIKRVVSQLGIYKTEDDNKLFTDYMREETKKHSSSQMQNTINTRLDIGATIIVEIGEYFLEFELWAPWQFDIELNSCILKNWVDAKGKTIAEINKIYGDVDISCLYGNELIDQNIKDIRFIGCGGFVEEFVFVLANGNELHLYESCDKPFVELYIIGKYEKMWQEGKMPMQQLANELIEKNIIPSDLDYKSSEAVQLAIKYQKEETQNNKQLKWKISEETIVNLIGAFIFLLIMSIFNCLKIAFLGN